MEELYNKILNSQPKDVRLIGTTKDEQYIVQLIMQLIAYETAKLRGCDIDKPKNLAKSVTVE